MVLWDVTWDPATGRFKITVTDGHRQWFHWTSSYAAGEALARTLAVTMVTGRRMIDGKHGRARPVAPAHPLHSVVPRPDRAS